jgi:hypothetical protein
VIPKSTTHSVAQAQSQSRRLPPWSSRLTIGCYRFRRCPNTSKSRRPPRHVDRRNAVVPRVGLRCRHHIFLLLHIISGASMRRFIPLLLCVFLVSSTIRAASAAATGGEPKVAEICRTVRGPGPGGPGGGPDSAPRSPRRWTRRRIWRAWNGNGRPPHPGGPGMPRLRRCPTA